jgi:hypothetical protein
MYNEVERWVLKINKINSVSQKSAEKMPFEKIKPEIINSKQTAT